MDLPHAAMSLCEELEREGAFRSKQKAQLLSAERGSTRSSRSEVMFVTPDRSPARESAHVFGIAEESDSIVVYATGQIDVPTSHHGHQVKLCIRPQLSFGSPSGPPNHYVRNGGRIACGSSCTCVRRAGAGTIGALVKNSEGDLCLLSNSHVIANLGLHPAGTAIFSPGHAHSGPAKRIGELHSHEPLHLCGPGSVNNSLLDVAIAKVDRCGVVSSWQGDTRGYDTPNDTENTWMDQEVKKFGYASELTDGVVKGRFPLLDIDVYPGQFLRFREVWKVVGSKVFAEPGDSGSLVVNSDHSKTVGLLFAGYSPDLAGFFFPIDRVLSGCKGLTLVTGHGV